MDLKWKMMNNPTKGELLGMMAFVTKQIETFDFMVASKSADDPVFLLLKKAIPEMLMPFLANSKDEAGLKYYIATETKRANYIDDVEFIDPML